MLVYYVDDYRNYDPNRCNDGGAYSTHWMIVMFEDKVYVRRSSSSYMIEDEEWIDDEPNAISRAEAFYNRMWDLEKVECEGFIIEDEFAEYDVAYELVRYLRGF